MAFLGRPCGFCAAVVEADSPLIEYFLRAWQKGAMAVCTPARNRKG